MNNRMPPATRKAGIEMPMKPSTASPKAAKISKINPATPTARQAILRRSALLIPRVSARKTGAMAMGSITTNIVTRAVII